MAAPPNESPPEQTEIAILGGGLAGLTLAVQLKQSRPKAQVTVVEARARPVPEGAYKVGESVVEVGSWYLREVLGLGEHLAGAQLPKFGLRYFMSAGDNRDIARRLEFGLLRVARLGLTLPFRGLPFTTYNVDRGKLENALARRARELGATLLDGTQVRGIDVSASGHRVELEGAGGRTELRARWLIDASGRRSLLKRELGLRQPVDHEIDARWMRVGAKIDPESWSEEASFRARTSPGLRRFSTNHLVGPSYWVWLIPLPGEATSVGIVVDERVHSLRDLRSPEDALAWLREREPQCAEALEAHQDKIWDFRRMRGGSFDCKRLFSKDRWAITGDSGIYADPLYSPGMDFIAIANTLICDLVCEELEGASITGGVQFAETLMRRIFEQYLLIYRGQYGILGSPRAMLQKVIWDTAAYFAFNTLLFHNGRLTDRHFLARARAEVEEIGHLQRRVQACLRERAQREPGAIEGLSVDQSGVPFLHELYMSSGPAGDDEALHAKLRDNLRVLRAFAGHLLGSPPREAGAEIDLGPELAPLCP